MNTDILKKHQVLQHFHNEFGSCVICLCLAGNSNRPNYILLNINKKKFCFPFWPALQVWVVIYRIYRCAYLTLVLPYVDLFVCFIFDKKQRVGVLENPSSVSSVISDTVYNTGVKLHFVVSLLPTDGSVYY